MSVKYHVIKPAEYNPTEDVDVIVAKNGYGKSNITVIGDMLPRAWVEKAPTLGAETHIRNLCVYNGKLYGGTYYSGKLYEWNGTNAWVEVAPKLGGEQMIRSMCVYNGKLYGGTEGNGKLYEWNAGKKTAFTNYSFDNDGVIYFETSTPLVVNSATVS